MKNIFFVETFVFLISGIALSLASGNLIMLAFAMGFDFAIALIQFVGMKLVLFGEDTAAKENEEDYSSYRSAHSL